MTDLEDLPASMRWLPQDVRRRLPVPVVNDFFPGPHDFTVINEDVKLLLAQQRACGICARLLESYVAFLGGPRSAETRSYTDPPMHPDCARAALRLCPHIAIQRAKRANDSHLPEEAHTPAGFVEDKPQTWVLYLTGDYSMEIIDQRYTLFTPTPAIELEVYGYNEAGELVRE